MLKLLRETGLRFLWISVIVIAVDLWTKYAVLGSMKLFESIQLTSFFNLTYVRNYGAAFSFLHEAGGWQRWLFTGIAVAVSIMILWYLRQMSKQQLRLPIAFSFILGGAIGNVYDRLVHGYVVDFLDFYVGTYHWPAFNIADSAIFIGAALLILDMLVSGKDSNPPAQTDEQK